MEADSIGTSSTCTPAEMTERKREATFPLTSDPEVLLEYLDELPSDDDSGSDSEFDGYVEQFDEDEMAILDNGIVQNCNNKTITKQYKIEPSLPPSLPAVASSITAADSNKKLVQNQAYTSSATGKLKKSTIINLLPYIQFSCLSHQLHSPLLLQMLFQVRGYNILCTKYCTMTTGTPFTGEPGLKIQMSSTDPIDYFSLFVTDNIKELIYTESVRYGSQYLEDNAKYLSDHK